MGFYIEIAVQPNKFEPIKGMEGCFVVYATLAFAQAVANMHLAQFPNKQVLIVDVETGKTEPIDSNIDYVKFLRKVTNHEYQPFIRPWYTECS